MIMVAPLPGQMISNIYKGARECLPKPTSDTEAVDKNAVEVYISSFKPPSFTVFRSHRSGIHLRDSGQGRPNQQADRVSDIVPICALHSLVLTPTVTFPTITFNRVVPPF